MANLHNRGWSSRDQNKALSELKELLNIVVGMYDDVADAISRNRYSPGVKKRTPGELGEMEGTPPPVLTDPTGENATWPDEIDDLIDRKVRAMVRTIGHVRNTARWMKVQSARRTVEVEKEEYLKTVCQACRTGGHPRLIRLYCRSCYDRWVYLGRPNRVTFEVQRCADLHIPEIPTAHAETETTRPGNSGEIPTGQSIFRGTGDVEFSVEGAPDDVSSPFAASIPVERNDEIRRAQN
jgi:hypothetical protein